MQHSRTAFAALTILALTACGAQSASSHSTEAALAAAASTTSAPAPTPTAAATSSATPAAVTATSEAPVRTTPAITRTPRSTIPVVVRVTVTADAAPGSVRPHFATPEAAMRYLAAAWNANDITALKHVSQGTARLLLLGMHHEAVNLRLDHCALRHGGNGDYLCHFVHDYPASYPTKLRQGRHGTSEFIAAPSSSVGWYMFAYEGCG
ncbi:MAG: hypothetical protein QOJ83_336 [Frankiales bacterium]|nr:hypothetical protein [Frankiales bacterium]